MNVVVILYNHVSDQLAKSYWVLIINSNIDDLVKEYWGHIFLLLKLSEIFCYLLVMFFIRTHCQCFQKTLVYIWMHAHFPVCKYVASE